MTGKIERLANAQRAKVERTQVETPTKTAAVARTSSPGVRNAFGKEKPTQVAPGNTGAYLAQSAQPDALWGGSEPRDTPASLSKLTPAQQVIKLGELRAERGELREQIINRMKELDAKWETLPAATKLEALKKYAETSEQLDPATRQVLERMIRHGEDAGDRIEGLRRRRDGMPAARYANADMKAQRAELNAELRAARKEHKACVKDATAVVDDAGLKADRLAVTEQIIDPGAPKASAPGSLLGMVTKFFNLSWITDWLSTKVSASQEKKHDKEIEKQLQAQLLDTHMKQMESKREVIKELALEASLRKR